MEVITVYFKEHFTLGSEEHHTNISQDNGTTKQIPDLEMQSRIVNLSTVI
jgi:hypothetical protein